MNIDASSPTGFALREFSYGSSYFSYGNVDPHNPSSSSSFTPWSWGTSVNGEPYVSSPGATIGFPGSIDLEHDAARVIEGTPWEIPSYEDFTELVANCDFIKASGEVITGSDKRTTVKGIRGLYLRSKINGKVLFIPMCGFGEVSSLTNRATSGYYWTKRLDSATHGEVLLVNANGVQKGSGQRNFGYPIRPIIRHT